MYVKQGSKGRVWLEVWYLCICCGSVGQHRDQAVGSHPLPKRSVYTVYLPTGHLAYNLSHPTQKFYLDLLFGDATHDQAAPDLKKKALSDLALRLRELNVKISNIRREQQYQKDREAQFRDTSESANAHVRNWTILQLVVLGVTCMWQLSHLRKFFVAKKLGEFFS